MPRNVGRLVRVVIKMLRLHPLRPRPKEAPTLQFHRSPYLQNHFRLTVGLKAVRKIDSGYGIRHGLYLLSKIS